MDISKERIRSNRIIRHGYYFAKSIVSNTSLRKKAEHSLYRFDEQYDAADKEKILNDMLRMYRLYGYGFDEYLAFHFSNRSLEDRKQFVAEWEHFGYSCVMNNSANDYLFDNKYETYQRFKPYFKRKCFLVDRNTSYQEFLRFADGLESFAVKPLNSSLGKGFQILQAFKGEDDYLDFKCQMGGYSWLKRLYLRILA